MAKRAQHQGEVKAAGSGITRACPHSRTHGRRGSRGESAALRIGRVIGRVYTSGNLAGRSASRRGHRRGPARTSIRPGGRRLSVPGGSMRRTCWRLGVEWSCVQVWQSPPPRPPTAIRSGEARPRDGISGEQGMRSDWEASPPSSCGSSTAWAGATCQHGGRRRPATGHDRQHSRRASPDLRRSSAEEDRLVDPLDRRSSPKHGYEGARCTADHRRRPGLRRQFRRGHQCLDHQERRAQLEPQVLRTSERQDDVRLGILRVAPHRWRPASCAPRRGESAMIVCLDKKTGGDIWKSAMPQDRRRGEGRSRLLLDRGFERRRGEAVRPARRPRRARRAGLRWAVPVGLQPRRQRRGQHPDPGRFGRLRLRVERLWNRLGPAQAVEGRQRREGRRGRISSTPTRSRTITAE